MKGKRWTIKELEKHIKINTNDTYSMAVPLSAMFKYLYGEFPKGIGLSGAQAEYAEQVLHKLPFANRNLMTLEEQSPTPSQEREK